MERRTLLKNIALISLALPLKGFAFSKKPQRPFHRFTLGSLELTVITDGHLTLSPVQPNFPNGPEAAEKELLRMRYRPEDKVELGMNVLVIKSGKDVVLVDTGAGGGFGPDAGWLMSSLADAGITPENITAIVVSHGHPDHIGGLLTKDNTPAFPAAQVFVSKIEYDFWMAPTQDFSKSKFQDKGLLKTFTQLTQNCFRTLGDRLQKFEDKAELFGFLKMEIAPGHTPGHALTHVRSGGERIVHIADLLHSDVLSFPHPEWGFNGDSDIDLAAATRRKVLATLAKEQTKVFAYHLPWPGIGHVNVVGKGFEWVPETYAFPF